MSLLSIAKLRVFKHVALAITLMLAMSYSCFANAQTMAISGTLSLPDGALAAQNITFQVSARRTVGSFEQFSAPSPVILASANSLDFTINVPRDTAEEWRLIYFCNSGCDGYGSPASYNSAGTDASISAGELLPTLDAPNNYANLQFEVLAADVIQGRVSLPNDELAPAGGLSISVFAEDTTGPGFSEFSSVSIPANSNFVDYTLNVAGADATSLYRIGYSCQSDCPGLYLDIGHYTSAGVVENRNDADLLAGLTDHTGIDLVLPNVSAISGQLTMPTSLVGSAGGTRISVSADDLEGLSSRASSQVTILENATQINYDLDIQGNPASRWLISYNCISGCSGLYDDNSTRYSSSGTVVKFEAQTLLTGSSDYSNIDLNLLAEHTISGQVSLPNASDAIDDIELTIFASDVNDRGDVTFEQVTIASGTNSVNYSMTLPDLANLTADWQVGYFCTSNCNGFLIEGYYASGSTQILAANAELLEGTQNYPNIDLSLLSPNSLSGQLIVPGATLTSELNITVTANQQGSPQSFSQQVTVPANSNNQANFEVTISSASSDTWELSYECVSACPGFVATAKQNDSGTVAITESGEVYAGGTDVTDVSFPLLVADIISGTVALPSDAIAPVGGTFVTISALDESGTTSPSTVVTHDIVIASGNNSANYQLDTAPDADARWRVSYRCVAGCEGVLDDGFYSTSGTQVTFENRTVLSPAASSPAFPVVDINLIKADTISGTLSLFDNQTAPANGIEFRITVDSGDFTSVTPRFVSITESSNSTNYIVKVPSGTDGGNGWRVQHSCSSDCDGHSSTGYFTSANAFGTTATRIEAEFLTGGQDHPDTHMTTLPTFQIGGVFALPNGELAPVDGFSASIQAIDSVNDGSAGRSFTIPQGQNSIAYSINISSDAAARWQVRYACFGDPICQGKLDSGFHTGSATGTGIGAAIEFDGGQNHSNVNLTVLDANVISGRVAITNSAVAPPGGINLRLFARPAQGPFVDADDITVVIAEGTSSSSYSLDVSTQGTEDWILSYLCRDNCNDFVERAFYSTLGTTTIRESATGLSPNVDHPNINLELLSSVNFSGELILEDGGLVVDSTYSVFVENTASGQRLTQQPISILAGADRTNFEIAVPTNTDTWTLSYRCETGCTGLTDFGFYTSNATVFDTASADALSASSAISGLELKVVSTIQIAGNFVLPNGLLANGDTSITLTLEGQSANIKDNQVITVANQQNSEAFSLSVPKSSETLTLSYACDDSCGFSSAAFFNSVLGTSQLQETNSEQLSGSVSRINQTFTGLAFTQLGGTLTIPPGLVSGTAVVFELALTQSTGTVTKTVEVEIPANGNDVNFSLGVEPRMNVSNVLGYKCVSDFATCRPFFDGFYQDGGLDAATLDQAQATSLAADSQRLDLNFTVIAAQQVSGEIRLANNTTAPASGIGLQIGIQRVPQTQNAQDNIFRSIFIPAGQSSVPYLSKISPDASANWLVSYNCVSGCENIVDRGFYASANTSVAYSAESTTISTTSSSNINLNLIPSNLVSGAVSFLPGRTAPAGGTQLEVRGFDTSRGFLSVQFIDQLSIPQGQTSANYQIKIPTVTSGRWQIDYLCISGCDNLALRAFYNASGTVIDSTQASLLAAGRAHNNINLLLLDEGADFNNDDDGDGVLNAADNCRFAENPDQADSDNDGSGDVCDTTQEDELCVPITTPTAVVLICL